MQDRALLCGVCCAAIILTSAACAQDTSKQDGAPDRPIAQNTTRLDEVVVTAQKVRTNVQRTPLAIQTISAQTIVEVGVETAKDLNRIVPGLSVQVGAAGGSSFYIRGVGNVNDLGTNDNGIAVSIDQTYFSRGYGPDMVLYDLDRIEVLKGPQGTLYGRNATGGTINFISTKPTLGVFNGYAGVEAGNYGELRFNGAVTLPISDTLAARVAFQTEQHGGYLTDHYDDLDTKGVRAHLLWKPTSDISVLVSGEYEHTGGKGLESIPYLDNKHFVTGNPYTGGESPAIQAFVAAAAPNFGNIGTVPVGSYAIAPGSCFPGCIPARLIQQQPGPYQVTDNGYLDNSIISFRGDVEWNLGFATLSVLPALLNTNYTDIFHNGPAPFFNAGASHQFSFETRLASPLNQRFTWIGGLFYQQENQAYRFVFPQEIPFAYGEINEPKLQDQTGGVFAQGTFKLLPDLSFTAGARYSFEDKASYNSDASNAADFPGLESYSFSKVNKERAAAPTYRFGLDWQVRPANLLYAYYATGFHSGGLEPGNPPTRPLCKPTPNMTSDQLVAAFTGCDNPGSYLPEYLNAAAIGSKNRFINDRFQLNLEIYDWEYKNLQVGTIGLDNPSITGTRIYNAGAASIRGVDVDSAMVITPDDRVTATINYNKSSYGTFIYYFLVYGLFGSVTDESHQPFINAPDLTMTANYEHTFHFANGGTLTPSARMQYSSTVNLAYGPLIQQGEYVKFDLDLAYRPAGGGYEARLFVRNVTDKATLVSAIGQDSATGVPYGNLAPPRTFGGSLTVHF